MRYIIATSLRHAKQMEADPRVVSVTMLIETFTRRQRVFAWLFWRVPVLRLVLRPLLRRFFFNPFATLVFAFDDSYKSPVAEESAPAPEIPTGDAADAAVPDGA